MAETVNLSEAGQILADLESQKAQEQAQADQVKAMDDLLDHCSKWLKSAQDWREQSFEDKWHSWQRYADAIYDPTLKARKKKWQSKAFVPIVPSHRETIKAQLYKTLAGARPILEVKARHSIPQEIDQGQNIRDLILREMEKSRFEVGVDAVLDDSTTFGSGFCRVRHEIETAERRVRVPIYGQVSPEEAQLRAEQGLPPADIQGYGEEFQQVEIYRGIKFEHLSIWDVFPDPKALKIRGNPIACRFHYVFGDIVKGAEEGYFLPDAVEKLRDMDNETIQPQEKMVLEADREIGPSNVERTAYGKRLECYELWMRLPKKWVLADGIDDPEKLVPARVIFVPGKAILAVELNDEYDGEPPIYKMDYMPVAGQFYGRGIPEMLKDIQDVVNETVNQRLDANSILLKPKFAVIEKGLVDKRDLDWDGDAAIRLNAKYVQDVRQGFGQVDTKDLGRMSVIEPQEMERYAQERTSANRVTLGTAGQVRDANDTATGQQILVNQAQGKFAYIGMLMEFSFLHDIFRAYWKQIYSNIQPEDVVNALGMEKAQTFMLMSPEEIEKDYVYQPQGIFEMENKAVTQARLQSIVAMFGSLPWFDLEAAHDKIVRLADLEPQELKLTPEELYQKLMAEGTMNMAAIPPGKSQPLNLNPAPSVPGAQGVR